MCLSCASDTQESELCDSNPWGQILIDAQDFFSGMSVWKPLLWSWSRPENDILRIEEVFFFFFPLSWQHCNRKNIQGENCSNDYFPETSRMWSVPLEHQINRRAGKYIRTVDAEAGGVTLLHACLENNVGLQMEIWSNIYKQLENVTCTLTNNHFRFRSLCVT